MLNPTVEFEDDSFMAVSKPSGWVVNDAATVKDTPVLQHWLQKQSFPIAKKSEFRSGIVHRLDKETSGIILVAKTSEMFFALQALFKERKIKKTYVALVHGAVKPSRGVIIAPVGRLPWNRERFGVLAGGRDAETTYECQDFYKKGDELFSLIEFLPKTGRTHQIRIHAKYISHPLVSDTFYAGRKTARKDRTWCPRLFLHAQEISFIHPKSQKEMTLEAKLPSDLTSVLKQLEKLHKTA